MYFRRQNATSLEQDMYLLGGNMCAATTINGTAVEVYPMERTFFEPT